MYYKIIVYKKHYKTIATKKSYKQYVYFEKVKTYHNIHKATLSKKAIEIFRVYNDWQFHVSEVLENERDTIIESNNSKTKQYFDMVQSY